MRKQFFILMPLVLFCFLGCQERSFYYESKSTPGFWHKDSIAKFEFKAPDTTNHYNFFIHIKNTSKYAYSNLFIITSMQFPHGKIIVDTLEYKMAFKDGRLMGEGLGSLKHNKLWYKEKIKFTETGKYSLQIKHAMRKANETSILTKLKGVEDIGFSYEIVNPKKS
ncbi:gliding motility lipoprotein GldH [Mesohalobacter halotolerans]|uniref:Gliding motility lipoprotein GldH n=1 Tax=Mesohalobacter halotolerans TaxID=1883405 RepID=A0A4U5TSW6_9FLAO|nr:gliding motility lipoprotein GldH [Mesohalobacter halotolerans]MBS3738938.1 gliding motility lipoprotein GldH [Psychroflexus sp.]TKS57122.1 gliding motility lipoprotein GldH [Mesohalobacter halotolerans]